MTGSTPRLLDWGWAGAALEAECGDVHVVAERPDATLVAVIDGLGHGLEAAVAARTAARVLETFAGEPLEALVGRCHEALRRTRGAVMSLASVAARGGGVTWGGVGNVEGALLRGDGAGGGRETLPLRGGIVGYQHPSLRVATLPLRPGDTLVLATDGIRDEFAEALPRDAPPQALADAILARYARGSDDALVLVARYLGPEAGAAEPGA